MSAIGYRPECELMEMIPTHEPVMTTRAELVAILEELRDVLVKIDNERVDRRYVDFGALAKRLEECIEKVEELPNVDGYWSRNFTRL